MRIGTFIVNTNREPTTKEDPETVVTCFNLLLKPKQKALRFLCVL